VSIFYRKNNHKINMLYNYLKSYASTLNIVVLIFLTLPGQLFSQVSSEELAKKLANPIASLISVPFQNNLEHGMGVNKGSKYMLNVQPVIPMKVSKNLNLITRWIVPIISQHNITGIGESQSGLGDAVISGFLSPTNTKNGVTWGAGPVFLVPLGGGDFLSGKQLGIGPTVVALKQKNGWTYGGLINQIWGTGGNNKADINQMFVNPFLTYNWKSGSGITAAFEWTENWAQNNSTLYFIPMFSGLTSFGKQKVSLAIGPKFNIAAPEALKSKFGLRAALVLLFPK
jgi:hypothetical protein